MLLKVSSPFDIKSLVGTEDRLIILHILNS